MPIEIKVNHEWNWDWAQYMANKYDGVVIITPSGNKIKIDPEY